MEATHECQHHANCGGYCETPEEIANALCQDCLEADRERDAEAAELKSLRAAMARISTAAGAGGTPSEVADAVTLTLSRRVATRKELTSGRDHLTTDGDFQSDKYTWCGAGFVPLKLTDPSARDLLITYAHRRAAVDARFGRDLLEALKMTPAELAGGTDE
jgi:hypothetical protein